jgi:hypothetical protein
MELRYIKISDIHVGVCSGYSSGHRLMETMLHSKQTFIKTPVPDCRYGKISHISRGCFFKRNIFVFTIIFTIGRCTSFLDTPVPNFQDRQKSIIFPSLSLQEEYLHVFTVSQ